MHVLNSLSVPLIGRYLLFTLLLVSLSIALTIVVLNVHFRSSSNCQMSQCTRLLFLRILPRLLRMRRLTNQRSNHQATLDTSGDDSRRPSSQCESGMTNASECASTTTMLPDEQHHCHSHQHHPGVTFGVKSKRSKVKFATESTLAVAAVCAASASVSMLNDKENCTRHANTLPTVITTDRAASQQPEVAHDTSGVMHSSKSTASNVFTCAPVLKRRGQVLEKALLNLRYLLQHLHSLDVNYEVSI